MSISAAATRIEKWTAATGTLTTPVALDSSSWAWALAADSAGDVYFRETGNQALEKWTAATGTVSTLVTLDRSSWGEALAVDGAGDVYFTEPGNNAIGKWTAATGTVSTLVSLGPDFAMGVAVDGAGNVYTYTANGAIREWAAASGTVATLVSAGLGAAFGVAVDGSGNVYIASTNSGLQEWTAATGAVSTLVSAGRNTPTGVAVDGAGNIFFADIGNGAIYEWPRAFVDTTAKAEPAAAGSDVLPVVLPATANLSGPFAPTSDAAWLTIGGINNGVVSFSFAANPGLAARTGHLMLLGQSIAVTQPGVPFVLAATNLLEGPGAGSDSVVLGASSPWVATANDSWLHVSIQSGAGSANVIFSFDANPGATRTGTLTIAGQTLAVTQAGASYVAANSVIPLVSSWAEGLAVDSAGDVYFSGGHAIEKWTAATGTLTTPVALDSSSWAWALAADSAGDVYFRETGNQALEKWTAATGTVSTLVTLDRSSWGEALAVDGAGDVYFTEPGNNAIGKWTAATGTVSTLVSLGPDFAMGVAVDGAGNVYTYTANGAIREWAAASGTVATLVSAGLGAAFGVAVDGSGNVYIASTNSGLQEWTAATGAVSTLVSAGRNAPTGVAVDGAGNIFFADIGNGAIYEWPRAFVDTTAKAEPAAAGSDVLPVVLPATMNLSGPFAPTSDAAWLTIGGINNGVVSFSFAANPGLAARTGHLVLLGQSIAVTQPGVPFVLAATNLLEGPGAGSDSVVLGLEFSLGGQRKRFLAACEQPKWRGQRECDFRFRGQSRRDAYRHAHDRRADAGRHPGRGQLRRGQFAHHAGFLGVE